MYHLHQATNVVIMRNNSVIWAGKTTSLLADPQLQKKFGLSIPSPPDQTVPQNNCKPDHDTQDGSEVSEAERTAGMTSLITTEDKTSGSSKMRMLAFYGALTGGWTQLASLGCIALLLTLSQTLSYYWFIWWTGDTFDLPSGVYLGTYLGLICLQAAITS